MLDEMVKHYLACALWSETDDNGDPLDGTYALSDFSEDALKVARQDCQHFLDIADTGDLSAEDLGHDFWLTRNGHGAGFWDRWLGELGDELTTVAEHFLSAYVYVGDDNKLYLG